MLSTVLYVTLHVRAFGVAYKCEFVRFREALSEEEDSKSESSDVESDESWEHQADK